jgi:aspartate/tyrosine/aromatic aminotransferase
MVEFMQQGTTVRTQVYYEAQKKLYRAIKNKRHGLQTSSIVLLHECACIQLAAYT